MNILRKFLMAAAIAAFPVYAVAAAPKIAVTFSDGSLQPGSTTPFNVAAGKIINANITNQVTTGTFVFSGSSIAYTNAVASGTLVDTSTTTHTGRQTFHNGIAISTGGQALLDVGTSTISLNAPTYIKGTITNDDAPSGFIGQYISSSVTTLTNFPTTNQYGDLASISLTQGDWDVTINGVYTPGTVDVQIDFGISTTAGNSSSGLQVGINEIILSTGIVAVSGSIAAFRASVASTTTHYFKMFAEYTGTTPRLRGIISARRRR